MAKALAEYTTEFKEVKKLVADGLEEIKGHAQYLGTTTGIMQAAALEIGKRVQELKSKGAVGNTLKDFLTDPEVKTMSSSLDQYMASLTKELNRMQGLQNGSFAMTKARFRKLWKDVIADIAARKKAVSTALGTGNKSLPDLVKLEKELAAFDQTSFTTFDSFVPEVASDHKKESDARVLKLITAAKTVVDKKDQEEMDLQALNPRVIGPNAGKAKQFREKVEAQAEKARKAAKSKELHDKLVLQSAKANKPTDKNAVAKVIAQAAADGKVAKELAQEIATAKAEAAKQLKELDKISEIYERAKKDQWIMKGLNDSADKSKILNFMKEIETHQAAADKEVKAIASLK